MDINYCDSLEYSGIVNHDAGPSLWMAVWGGLTAYHQLSLLTGRTCGKIFEPSFYLLSAGYYDDAFIHQGKFNNQVCEAVVGKKLYLYSATYYLSHAEPIFFYFSKPGFSSKRQNSNIYSSV